MLFHAPCGMSLLPRLEFPPVSKGKPLKVVQPTNSLAGTFVFFIKGNKEYPIFFRWVLVVQALGKEGPTLLILEFSGTGKRDATL